MRGGKKCLASARWTACPLHGSAPGTLFAIPRQSARMRAIWRVPGRASETARGMDHWKGQGRSFRAPPPAFSAAPLAPGVVTADGKDAIFFYQRPVCGLPTSLVAQWTGGCAGGIRGAAAAVSVPRFVPTRAPDTYPTRRDGARAAQARRGGGRHAASGATQLRACPVAARLSHRYRRR